MGFALKDIAYGWKIGVAAVLTGATIFVADNIRQRIYQRDFVEIALGVHERALATQYQTNPVAYYVDPPSFVRNWYSNDYVATVTNGVTNWTAVLYTNTYTNVISARTDRAMAVELDAKIKALIPYYVDTNSVFDGTTNIVMLSVTGLWASLGIGDRTNQFTSVPASGTNLATYGAYPWRIYKEDLEERYKVLNALKILNIGECVGTNLFGFFPSAAEIWGNSIGDYVEAMFQGDNYLGQADGTIYNIVIGYDETYFDIGEGIFIGKSHIWGGDPSHPPLGTPQRITFLVRNANTYSFNLLLNEPPEVIKIWNCSLVSTNGYVEWEDSSYDESTVEINLKGNTAGMIAEAKYDVFATITPQFNYCTNAYWE